LAERKDMFQVVLSSLNNSRQLVEGVLNLGVRTKERVREVIAWIEREWPRGTDTSPGAS
jgi:hypothetical protein